MSEEITETINNAEALALATVDSICSLQEHAFRGRVATIRFATGTLSRQELRKVTGLAAQRIDALVKLGMPKSRTGFHVGTVVAWLDENASQATFFDDFESATDALIGACKRCRLLADSVDHADRLFQTATPAGAKLRGKQVASWHEAVFVACRTLVDCLYNAASGIVFQLEHQDESQDVEFFPFEFIEKHASELIQRVFAARFDGTGFRPLDDPADFDVEQLRLEVRREATRAIAIDPQVATRLLAPKPKLLTEKRTSEKRDRWFLILSDRGLTPAQIRDQWNCLSETDRAAYFPYHARIPDKERGRNVVRQGIKRVRTAETSA